MTPIDRHVTNFRGGRAVAFNNVLYVGGQTANDKSLDIKGQMRNTLVKIEKVLADAGSEKNRLLTAQIWLKDIGRDFKGMNEVWDEWIDTDHAPTRATAQCEMASPEILVELIVTAALSE